MRSFTCTILWGKEVKLTMEVEWIADRATLRSLAREHPEWTQRDARRGGWSLFELGQEMARVACEKHPLMICRFCSHTHGLIILPPPGSILGLCNGLSRFANTRRRTESRTPGPRAILYYLHPDPELLTQGHPLPRSTRTIWRILRQLGCILDAPHHSHRPQEREDASGGDPIGL